MLFLWLSDCSKLSCRSFRRISNCFSACKKKILALTSSRMNFAGWQQSRHWQLSLPLCILKGNPTLCLLWRRSLSSLSLLLFSASSVKILFWRACSRQTAWSFTLLTWARGGSGRQMIRQNSSGSKNETSRDVCKARALLYLLPDVYESSLQLSAESLALRRALIQLPVTVGNSFLLSCERPHQLKVLLLQIF